jgi:hypothetical protein
LFLFVSGNVYIIPDTLSKAKAMQSVSNKVVSRIYGHGRGWTFTKKDFSDCGSSTAVEKVLPRLRKKGTIRQLLRGVYDYPRFSTLFKAPASAMPDQIAQAIARWHGWSIYPSGETALNLLGLSTQVPAKYVYFSNGPSKRYAWSGGELLFTKRAAKETGSLSSGTALVVQALKALGQGHIDKKTVNYLRGKLTAKEKAIALREARYVTGWVYEIIKKIAAPGVSHG